MAFPPEPLVQIQNQFRRFTPHDAVYQICSGSQCEKKWSVCTTDINDDDLKFNDASKRFWSIASSRLSKRSITDH